MTPELGTDNLSTLVTSPYPLQINTSTPSHSGEMKPFQRKQFTWQVSNSVVLLGKAVHLWMSRQMRHRGLTRYSYWLIVFASWKWFIVTATGDKVVVFFPSPCLFLVHPFPTCLLIRNDRLARRETCVLDRACLIKLFQKRKEIKEKSRSENLLKGKCVYAR